MAEKNGRERTRGRRFARGMAVTLVFLIVFYAVSSLAASAVIFSLLFSRYDVSEESLDARYSDLDPTVYPRREVSFLSDGNMLRGYFYGENSDKGMVVMVQGINSCADARLPEAVWLLDRGWAVFTFDGTGSGESQGESTVGLSRRKLDLIDAVRFVEDSHPELPVYLYGHSLGAYSVAASLDDLPEVRAAVCVSGFDSPLETMLYHARRYVGPLADIEYPFLMMQNYLAFGSEGNEAAAAAISSGGVPVLVVYGSEDETVPEEISLYSRRDEIRNPNAEYILVTEEYRSGHSAVWLSREAAEYLSRKAGELDRLHETYGDSLPDEVLANFVDGFDRTYIYAVDADFMRSVESFFSAAG